MKQFAVPFVFKVSAYQKALDYLLEGFGQDDIVKVVLRNKLEQWPKIETKDYSGFKKYFYFLEQCLAVQYSFKAFSALD